MASEMLPTPKDGKSHGAPDGRRAGGSQVVKEVQAQAQMTVCPLGPRSYPVVMPQFPNERWRLTCTPPPPPLGPWRKG